MDRLFTRLLCLVAILIAPWIDPRLAIGQAVENPRRLEQSVERGLAYLAHRQRPDGSFEGAGPRLAMTGLALLAFLSNGHTPEFGRYGDVVRRAGDHLLSHMPSDGYIGRIDGSRMYGQGIITLALAELYGVELDPVRRRAIRQAVGLATEVILRAQDVPKPEHHAGGWRYEPGSTDSDLSLSGWNALALRAVTGSGAAEVPPDSVRRAVAYVLKCFHGDRGGFSYQPGHNPNPGVTAVAVLNLHLMDASDRAETQRGAQFLLDHAVTENTRFGYYAFYYTTQAAYQSGRQVWPVIWKRNSERLMALQMDDGGWPQSATGEEPGRIYATSMSVLALSVPMRLLPTYQR